MAEKDTPKWTVALRCTAQLGECPRWHAQERMLYWVDIGRCELHRFDPAKETDEKLTLDQPVGCFAFTSDGGLLLGMKDGFARMARWSSRPEPFGEQILAGSAHLRMNDGRTDNQGRFWAGSVDMKKEARDAALYCLEPDGTIRTIENAMLTCNGAAFSNHGKRFFHTDTPSHAVRSYDVDGAAGVLRNRHIFHQFPQGHGRPDGGSADADGHYWTALFDGGRVVRLSPEGEIVQTVDLPVSRPTMIAFGGDDLRTAYVTTARTGLDTAQIEQEPLAGSIFCFRVETPGLPERPFGGSHR